MSRKKRQFSATIALLSLALLFLGPFIGGSLSRAVWHVPTPIKLASRADAATLTLEYRPTYDVGLLLLTNAESIPQAFAIARENRVTFIRDTVANLVFLRVTLTSKLSSRIARSVLNL